MRHATLLSLTVIAVLATADATTIAAAGARQGTAKPTAKPQTAKPQSTAKPAQPAGRSGIALLVTTPRGATIPGVRVELIGPTDRSGETNDSGQLNFTGLQAGTYRLRFTGEEVTAFEREVTLAAGRTATLDISLNPAPPPREVIKVTEAPPPAPGPAGEPRTMSIPNLLESEFVGREPRRETLLSCSGDLRTTMLQLNEPLPDRLYTESDVAYYVLGGEGTITMAGREPQQLRTNDFASVPRGITHSLARRGNRPLVVLAVLGGAPCEQAK